jgi:hypothetical protein
LAVEIEHGRKRKAASSMIEPPRRFLMIAWLLVMLSVGALQASQLASEAQTLPSYSAAPDITVDQIFSKLRDSNRWR